MSGEWKNCTICDKNGYFDKKDTEPVCEHCFPKYFVRFLLGAEETIEHSRNPIWAFERVKEKIKKKWTETIGLLENKKGAYDLYRNINGAGYMLFLELLEWAGIDNAKKIVHDYLWHTEQKWRS